MKIWQCIQANKNTPLPFRNTVVEKPFKGLLWKQLERSFIDFK